MRRARFALLLVSLLLLSAMPLTSADEGRATPCNEIGFGAIPASVQTSIPDQECRQVSLGTITPGTVVEFDLTADFAFDFLVFSSVALDSYANDQSYRSAAYWAEDTVFESFSGSARWHWTVPTDQSEKNWFAVLDNLAHPGDGGEGAQGGGMVMIDLAISLPNPNAWTLHDGLVNLGVNSHQKLVDENLLVLDEGSQIAIGALPMSGVPDVFLLTASQRLSYLDGTSPEFRVPGADLLSVTTADSTVFTVDAMHANQPLYLYADNEAGPIGGGDGQTAAIFTVIVALLPVLDATISGMGNLTVDVGEPVMLSANNTPNMSDQVDTSAHEWDLDSDGQYELNRAWAETSWANPGNHTIRLRVHGTDGRLDSANVTFIVQDMTDPLAIINGGTNLVRGFGESFTLASSSTDNHMIDREEWWVDETLHTVQNGTGNSFVHTFFDGGDHEITLKAFDFAGRGDETSVEVNVRDISAPQVGTIAGPTEVDVGDDRSWTLSANDNQSAVLTWTWDFDRSVDSDQDGDSTNDVEATGALVEWTFEKAGTYSITCSVTNAEGLTTQEELSVHVSGDETLNRKTTEMVLYGGGILGIIVVLVGGFLLFQRVQQSRANEELMQMESSRRAEEKAEAAHEPGHEEQLTMFQRSESAGYGRRDTGDEMSQIAGVGGGYSAAPVAEARPISASDAELLAAFDDSEPEPEPAAKAEPAPAQKASPEPEEKPVQGSATVLSSGIELPGVLHDVAKREAAQNILVEPAPAPQSAPEPSTELVAACDQCGQRYAVDMPSGIAEARIDCPKCGARNTIRR